MKILRVAAIAVVLTAACLSQGAVAGPRCFQQFMRDTQDCSNLGSFWARSTCGLDAAHDLWDCVYRSR